MHTFGKIAGGGLPIGIFGGRREIMEKVLTPATGTETRGEIFQSGTFSGNSLSMAAGLRVLEELEKGHVLPFVNGQAVKLREGWRKACDEVGLAAQIVGVASLASIFFTERPIRSRRDVLESDKTKSLIFSLGLLANGVYLLPHHVALTSTEHSDTDIEMVLEISSKVLAAMKWAHARGA